MKSLTTLCNLSVRPKPKMKQVLLATAIIKIYHSTGQGHLARPLLNGCSQNSFVTTCMYHRLWLKARKVNLQVTGLNDAQTRAHHHRITYLVIQNADWASSHRTYQNLPLWQINHGIQIPETIQLMDPQFPIPSKIDLLIRADIFWDLLTGSQITINPGFPKLHGTVFGYIAGGQILEQQQHSEPTVSLTCTVSNLNKQMQMFWRRKSINNDRMSTLEERECEQHYNNNNNNLY